MGVLSGCLAGRWVGASEGRLGVFACSKRDCLREMGTEGGRSMCGTQGGGGLEGGRGGHIHDTHNAVAGSSGNWPAELIVVRMLWPTSHPTSQPTYLHPDLPTYLPAGPPQDELHGSSQGGG